jgi:hypothetical protein
MAMEQIREPIDQAEIDARLEAERKREDDEETTAWAFIWTLFAFKLATGIAIFWAAGWTKDAGEILGATHWFFLFVPAFAIAAPLTYQWRVRKARRRRRQLQRSEWMIDPNQRVA